MKKHGPTIAVPEAVRPTRGQLPALAWVATVAVGSRNKIGWATAPTWPLQWAMWWAALELSAGCNQLAALSRPVHMPNGRTREGRTLLVTSSDLLGATTGASPRVYARMLMPLSLFLAGMIAIRATIDILWLHNSWLSLVVAVTIVVGPLMAIAGNSTGAMLAARKVTDEHGQPYIQPGAASITLAASWPKGQGLASDLWTALETEIDYGQVGQLVTVARTRELAHTYGKYQFTAVPGFPTVLYRQIANQ